MNNPGMFQSATSSQPAPAPEPKPTEPTPEEAAAAKAAKPKKSKKAAKAAKPKKSKKSAKLSAAEIEALNAKRAKALASKNKPKKARKAGKHPALAAPYGKKRRKRGRGRPPGSRNKPKAVTHTPDGQPLASAMPKGYGFIATVEGADAFGAFAQCMRALKPLPEKQRMQVLNALINV